MALNNLLSPRQQVQNAAGAPLAGGKVFLFEPGTSTAVTSFKEPGLVNANTHPVRLSGSGRATIWVTRDVDIVITDRNSGDVVPTNIVSTQDNANPDQLGVEEAGGLVPNGSFEIDADSNDVPDGWVEVANTGSNNGIDTSESTDGGQSFRFTSSGTGGGSLTTDAFFPVNDTENLRVNVDLRSTVATVRNIIRVEWYDASQVAISNSDPYDSTSNPTTFAAQTLSVAPPANARFAKLRLIGCDPSVAVSGSTYFDRVQVFYPAVVSGSFDNLLLSGNEIQSTNTNGQIILDPNGTGQVILDSNAPQIRSTGNTDAETRLLELAHQDGTRRAFLGHNGDSIFRIRSEVHGSALTLEGEDAGGVARNLYNADPDGDAVVYQAGSIRALTHASGWAVRGSAINDVSMIWQNTSGTTRGLVGYQGADRLDIENQVNSGTLRMRANNAGGTATDLFLADPVGDFSLHRAGANILASVAQGIVAIRSAASTDAENRLLRLAHQDGTSRAFVGHSADGQLRLRNEVHGQPVLIEAEETGGTLRTLISADPDDDISLYRAGNVIAGSSGVGDFSVRSSGNSDTDYRVISLRHQDGTERGRIGYSNSGELSIRNLIHGASVAIEAENAGGALTGILSADPDGGTTLLEAGNERLILENATGYAALRKNDNVEATDLRLQFQQADSTIRAELGLTNSEVQFINRIHGALTRFFNEDNSGVARETLRLDGDGGNLLINAGQTVLQSIAGSSGGINIRNDLTGDGLERALTISDLNTAVATSSQTVTSDDTVNNDAALSLALSVGRHAFEAYIQYDEDTASGQGIKYTFAMATGSGGGTFVSVVPSTVVNTGTGDSSKQDLTQTVEITLNANTVSRAILVHGIVNVTVAGTFRFQWAQSTSSANGTTRAAGSYLTARRLT